MPKTTIEVPDGGVSDDVVASVMTSCVVPVNAPAGTVAVTVVVPRTPAAVPPVG